MLEFKESALYLSHVAVGGSSKIWFCYADLKRHGAGCDIVLVHGTVLFGLTT